MKQQSPSQLRTAEVWRRFVGLFGGEAVARKYGDAPPAEWIGVLSDVNDWQLERGMRRLVRSGKAHVPALPEFLKLCRAVGDEELDGPDVRMPRLQAPDTFSGDEWTMAGNRHLLAHIRKSLAVDSQRYGRPDSYNGALLNNHSPDFAANVGLLVSAKSAWAADMRDLARNAGGTDVPVHVQREIWDDYIGRAEAQILQKAAA